MDYLNYIKMRETLLPNNDLVDQGDIDLYAKYPPVTINTTGHIDGEVYRCHLAEDFLRENSLDIPKQEILISHGVRNSLETLYTHFKDKKWLIPADCYPWYNKKAEDHQLKTVTYTVLKKEENIFQDLHKTDTDVLLTNNPLKPTGRDFTSEEWDTLEMWLSDPNKTLIIDAVYSLEIKTMDKLWEMYNTHTNIIICYSLSKAYATPKAIGVTFTKNRDLIPVFRAIPKDKTRLQYAYTLLNHEQERREQIKNDMRKASEVLQQSTDMKLSEHTYMFYEPNLSQADLLQERTLAIPVSIYGSQNTGVIKSGLNLNR